MVEWLRGPSGTVIEALPKVPVVHSLRLYLRSQPKVPVVEWLRGPSGTVIEALPKVPVVEWLRGPRWYSH